MQQKYGTNYTVPGGDGNDGYKIHNVNDIKTGYSGDLTLSVTTNASNTGYTGSGTAIDMRTRRLNSVVWRRTA
jgi:hypothetical protein